MLAHGKAYLLTAMLAFPMITLLFTSKWLCDTYGLTMRMFCCFIYILNEWLFSLQSLSAYAGEADFLIFS